MKNRNTSWQDKDKLELLVATGIENVTAVINGIAFNGKIPFSFQEQAAFNEMYAESVNNRCKKLNDAYYIEQKTRILKRASCSRDIAQELSRAVDNYYWECESDNFAVTEVPYGIDHDIENLLALLSDLASYTAAKRLKEVASDDLGYLSEFWIDEVSEYEEEDLEDAEAEAATKA